MDQYDKAVIRAEKQQAHNARHKPLSPDNPVFQTGQTAGETLHLPNKARPPKTSPKRTNEIAITIYADGEEINLTVFVNLNDIIASQRNRVGFSTLLRDALSPKFGKVEIK